MDISLRQLRIVDAITREGGAGAAARRLRLTQPAVSHAVRKLEDDLGVALFHRKGRGMAPTLAGLRVADTAGQVLGAVARLRYDLEQLGADRQGTLRVATECYTCYRWLPAVIQKFRSEFPGFEVEIVPEASYEPFVALRRGDVELVVTHSMQGDHRLSQRPLFRDELLAVFPPGHPLCERDYLEPTDFVSEPVVVHSDPLNSVLVRRFLAPAGVQPKRFLSLQLTTAVLEAVRAGLGITVLAHWVVADELTAGNLVGRSLGTAGLFRDWCITTLKDHAERPAVAAFTRLVVHELGLRGRAETGTAPALSSATRPAGPWRPNLG